jgi:hypothetical protein
MTKGDKKRQCTTINQFGGVTDMVLRWGSIRWDQQNDIFLHQKRNANAINLNSLVISAGCIAVNYFYFISFFA